MKGHTRIVAAQESVTNLNGAGNAWLPTLQVMARRGRLYKLSIASLSAADLYLWIFDVAAGTSASVAPVHIRYGAAGLADTWDLGTDGAIFKNGLYLALSTANAVNPASTVTDAGNNAAILKVEYHITDF